MARRDLFLLCLFLTLSDYILAIGDLRERAQRISKIQDSEYSPVTMPSSPKRYNLQNEKLDSESSLQLDDAVIVNRSSNTPSNRVVEGVVAYLGPVKFDSTSPRRDTGKKDETSWVGIRLTGASVGQGKNNGTVQGVTYFHCPENCGIFVRMGAVTKSTMTTEPKDRQQETPRPVSLQKITVEETQKRSRGATSPSHGYSKSNPSPTTPSRSKVAQTPTPDSTSTASSVNEHRREALRLRREALQDRRRNSHHGTANQPLTVATATTPRRHSPAMTPKSTRDESSSSELHRQLDEMRQQLHRKEQDMKLLQEQLVHAQQECLQAQNRIFDLETNGHDDSASPSSRQHSTTQRGLQLKLQQVTKELSLAREQLARQKCSPYMQATENDSSNLGTEIVQLREQLALYKRRLEDTEWRLEQESRARSMAQEFKFQCLLP